MMGPAAPVAVPGGSQRDVAPRPTSSRGVSLYVRDLVAKSRHAPDE
jgi:hypothetical protein